MSERRVLRPVGTAQQQQQRLRELRTEMDTIGTDEAPPLPPEKPDTAGDKFEDVLEGEIRRLIRLNDQTLWPKDRTQLLKAGVALLAVRNKIGPQWGGELEEPE